MESLMSREELQNLAGQTLLAVKATQEQMGLITAEIKDIRQSMQKTAVFIERTETRLDYLERKGPGGREAKNLRDAAISNAVYREIKRSMPEAFTEDGNWRPLWVAKGWNNIVSRKFYGRANSDAKRECRLPRSKDDTSFEDAHNVEMMMSSWEPRFTHNGQTGSLALAQYCREIINEKRR